MIPKCPLVINSNTIILISVGVTTFSQFLHHSFQPALQDNHTHIGVKKYLPKTVHNLSPLGFLSPVCKHYPEKEHSYYQ